MTNSEKPPESGLAGLPDGSRLPDPPAPVIEPHARWMPSLVWVVPLIAALIGLSLVVKTVLDRGPTITIRFGSAEGIEPGKTKVKFKDVDVGEVKTVTLSQDLSRVIVGVELSKDADKLAVQDTRFWIVRPRVAASGVSGLGTLLSGSYIGVDVGRSPETRKDFVGLEIPPAVTRDLKGHQFVLHGDNLGSLDIGSPVFYRRVQVGQVVAFNLDRDGTGVTLRAFVNAPYDQYVGANSRWWHASGVDVRLNSNGFKLNTQSLAAVVIGGIAFQSPPNQPVGQPAPDNATFTLAANENNAMREPDGPPVSVVLNFNQSLRGLSPGAPVDFRGIVLGQVRSIHVDYDPRRKNFKMPVTVDLYPDRLGPRFKRVVGAKQSPAGEALLQTFVAHGLRAQLRTGNLLTSQLYVALDFFPHAVPVRMDLQRRPVELPTVLNTLDQLQQQVADIATKLDKVPFDRIGNNLNSALKSANSLFKQLDTQVAPEARVTLDAAHKTFSTAEQTLQQDSPLQNDVHQTLQQLTRTLQSLNELADYLERHPESLLRGKKGDQP